MLDRYEAILDRYAELSAALAEPETLANQPLWQRLLKERAGLEEQVDAYKVWLRLDRQRRDCLEMMDDPDLSGEARTELAGLTPRLADQELLLKRLLLPKDSRDERNVILEIRAGTGGEESALFAGDLARMYERYAVRCGFRIEAVSVSETDLGGIKEGVFLVTGKGAWSRLKFESGVHRVQRVPVTESSGRKQTSACTVAVLPEAEEIEMNILPQDLRIDTFRASGAGGQYVNRTDSAIRITHLPTGLVVTCQDEKSQLRNKESAMKVLRSRLWDMKRREADASQAADRKQQVGTGDRSERIRTYNFHEGRVTDHRIGLTLYRIQDIMDGDLDEIIDALRLADENSRLAAADSAEKT